MAESNKDEKIIAVVDDDTTTLKMIGRKTNSFHKKMNENGFTVRVFKGSNAFFDDLDSIKNDLVLILSDYDMSSPSLGVNGNEFLEEVRDKGINVPFILVSNQDLETRKDEFNERDLKRLRAEYLDSGSSSGKVSFYNKPEIQDKILNIIGLKGKGLSTNSYGITTVISRVDKFNQLREQRLRMAQSRGFNARMNQQLNEINSVRNYSK